MCLTSQLMSLQGGCFARVIGDIPRLTSSGPIFTSPCLSAQMRISCLHETWGLWRPLCTWQASHLLQASREGVPTCMAATPHSQTLEPYLISPQPSAATTLPSFQNFSLQVLLLSVLSHPRISWIEKKEKEAKEKSEGWEPLPRRQKATGSAPLPHCRLLRVLTSLQFPNLTASTQPLSFLTLGKG